MNDSRAASDLETARRRAFARRWRFGDDGDGDGDDGGGGSPPPTSPSPPAPAPRSFLPNSRIQRQRQREGPPPRTPLALVLLPPSLCAVAAYVPALTTIATYFNTKSTAHVRHVASTNPGAAPSASCDASGRGETLVSQ